MLKEFMWYDDTKKDAEEMMTEQQQQQAAGEKQGPAPVAVAMLDEVLLLLLHPFNGLFSRITWVSWYQNGTRSFAITEVPNTHSSLD